MAPARSSVDFAPVFWAVALAALLCFLVAAQAWAQSQKPRNGWELCNFTSYILEAATGRPDNRAVAVQGWIRLRPGQCALAAPAPLTRGVHYVYARTSTAHRGGRRQWGGDAKLCVDPSSSFAMQNPASCEQMGLEERQFRRVQINKREQWRTSFAEANKLSVYSARSQGVQRLLADAGFDVRTAAGEDDPRRAAAAISQFRGQARLPPSANEDQIIDALETNARRRAASIGLTLCNRASSRIWTAIARRRGEGWESRGWWALSPGGCARTIDDPLAPSAYFVHAVLESAQGERYLASAGEAFCTSPSKFAILERTRCGERYYDESLFTALTSDGREGLVVEFKEPDFLPSGQKPLPSAAQDQILANSKPTEDQVRGDRDLGRAPKHPGATPRDRALPRSGGPS
jgi:uncharacterized membrane protein